jgi:hypothetical protein
MAYIYRQVYIDIKCKYVYIHIRVSQQLEYTLKSKITTKKRRDPLVTVGD